MTKFLSTKNLWLVLAVGLTLSSCNKSGGGKSKSSVTGWNYDDKNLGNFHVTKLKYPKAGPGLVFIQGGTYVMGSKNDDVMSDWNNTPRRVTVSSFYIDETEVANVHYREYLHWLGITFGGDSSILNKCIPDSLVWREELSYNEPYVESYFRYPSYNFFPVVGVSWKQAHDFCTWRTDRVNELKLLKMGYLKKDAIKKSLRGGGADASFNTETYLMNPEMIQGKSKPTKSTLKDANNKVRNSVNTGDGILSAAYRLPTEAEWEYAAYGLNNQNPQPRRSESKSGEELISNQQIYSWSRNVNGFRENHHGSFQGKFLANFKRGSGDNMGVFGGLNDRAAITANVKSFYPNSFGLYNMCGNVSEWVEDVYRPMTPSDGEDFNYFRGNRFQKYYKNSSGEYERDSMGHLKKVDISDEEIVNRTNYYHNNSINYLDGDSSSTQAYYNYGMSTLINDNARVIKGGSWNDRPYWLSPGTRRFMQEDQSASTVGFRCAQNYLGPPEGPGFQEGNIFGKQRQKKGKK